MGGRGDEGAQRQPMQSGNLRQNDQRKSEDGEQRHTLERQHRSAGKLHIAASQEGRGKDRRNAKDKPKPRSLPAGSACSSFDEATDQSARPRAKTNVGE